MIPVTTFFALVANLSSLSSTTWIDCITHPNELIVSFTCFSPGAKQQIIIPEEVPPRASGNERMTQLTRQGTCLQVPESISSPCMESSRRSC